MNGWRASESWACRKGKQDKTLGNRWMSSLLISVFLDLGALKGAVPRCPPPPLKLAS